MEKEALIELMRELFPTLVEEMILPEVRKENGKFAASLNKKLEKVTQPEPREDTTEEAKDRLSLKALQQQVDLLKTELAEKEQRAFESERSAAISKIVSGSPAINKGLLGKVFASEYANQLQKEGDSWYLEREGEVIPIDKVLESYLGSEDGKLFLPASNVSGSGSSESKSQIVTPNKELTIEQRYAELQQQHFG